MTIKTGYCQGYYMEITYLEERKEAIFKYYRPLETGMLFLFETIEKL